MMLSLSASDPTDSATRRPRFAHRTHHFRIDALDQVVAPLIERIDGALRRRDDVVVVRARSVLFVPQLDVRTRQAGNQLANAVAHALLGHGLSLSSFRTAATTCSAPMPAMNCSPAARRLARSRSGTTRALGPEIATVVAAPDVHDTGDVGPNTVTRGTPNASAMCAGPVSPDTNTQHPANTAATRRTSITGSTTTPAASTRMRATNAASSADGKMSTETPSRRRARAAAPNSSMLQSFAGSRVESNIPTRRASGTAPALRAARSPLSRSSADKWMRGTDCLSASSGTPASSRRRARWSGTYSIRPTRDRACV